MSKRIVESIKGMAWGRIRWAAIKRDKLLATAGGLHRIREIERMYDRAVLDAQKIAEETAVQQLLHGL